MRSPSPSRCPAGAARERFRATGTGAAREKREERSGRPKATGDDRPQMPRDQSGQELRVSALGEQASEHRMDGLPGICAASFFEILLIFLAPTHIAGFFAGFHLRLARRSILLWFDYSRRKAVPLSSEYSLALNFRGSEFESKS